MKKLILPSLKDSQFFFTTVLLFGSIRHQSCCHCHLRHWASTYALVPLQQCIGKTQDLNLLMNSQYCSLEFDIGNSYSVCNVVFMLTELNAILDERNQRPLQSPQRAVETSDTSGDDSDNSRSRREIQSKKNLQRRRAVVLTNLAYSLSPS